MKAAPESWLASSRALFGGTAVVFSLTLLLAHLPSTSRWIGPRDAEARALMGPAQRALGPLASVLASAEWVRFREALRAGDTTRAYDIAERALQLDPRSERGWFELSQHLVFERGSFLENESSEDRRRWIQAGLDVLARGETKAAEPAELAFFAGNIRSIYLAGIPDEDLGWPGGPTALIEAGRRDLMRAAAAGRKDAQEIVEALDEAVRDTESGQR